MNDPRWPNPGDLLTPKRGRFATIALAFNEPRIESGVVDIETSEALLVIARALNPSGDHSEEGIDARLKAKWQRPWWMVFRPCGKFAWITDAQMVSMYDVQRA